MHGITTSGMSRCNANQPSEQLGYLQSLKAEINRKDAPALSLQLQRDQPSAATVLGLLDEACKQTTTLDLKLELLQATGFVAFIQWRLRRHSGAAGAIIRDLRQAARAARSKG